MPTLAPLLLQLRPGQPVPHVALLMGGPSSEAEVSRRGGTAVANALKEAGLRVTVVDFKEAALPVLPPDTDVVFPVLHGVFGEDGQLQKLLEAKGLPYVGSDAVASDLIMSKQATKDRLAERSLPVIPGFFLCSAEATMTEQLFLPLIVKPNREGSTFGLHLVRTVNEWREALTDALSFGGEVVVEEYIEGKEVTVAVLDGRALPVVEIVPPGPLYDYNAKYTYSQGKTEYFCPPANIPVDKQAEMATLAERAFAALGARDLLRVDMLMRKHDGQLFILEANSLPGFTGTSLFPKAAAALGITFGELCVHLALTAAKRGKKK